MLKFCALCKFLEQIFAQKMLETYKILKHYYFMLLYIHTPEKVGIPVTTSCRRIKVLLHEHKGTTSGQDFWNMTAEKTDLDDRHACILLVLFYSTLQV